jgi:hypothetical protein
MFNCNRDIKTETEVNETTIRFPEIGLFNNSKSFEESWE